METGAKDPRPIILIDGLNNFARAYCAVPAMSSSGEHVGGIVGFLTILKSLANKFSPHTIVIAWEGGGSPRRRALFPEYKQRRRSKRLNRFYGDDIPDGEENRTRQLIILVSLLKLLPVRQVYVSGLEGDDVIAYICRCRFENFRRIIVSSDRDMMQLVNQSVSIYLPARKAVVVIDDVKKEFKISPTNFAIAKAIVGDPSDNIPGVRGAGYHTLSKRFPALIDDVVVNVDDVLGICDLASKQKNAPMIYKKIFESRDLIERNLKLVDLSSEFAMSFDQAKKIDAILENSVLKIDKLNFIRSLMSAGISGFDVDGLFLSLVAMGP